MWHSIVSGHLMFVVGRVFTIRNLTSNLAIEILAMFQILMSSEVESVWKSLATYRTRENGCLFFSFHNHLGTGFLVPLHVFTWFHNTTKFTLNGWLYFTVHFGIMFLGKLLSTFWTLIWNWNSVFNCLCFIPYNTLSFRIGLFIFFSISLGFSFLCRKVQIIYLLRLRLRYIFQ